MTLVDAPSGTPTDDSLDGTAEADRPAEARGSAGEAGGSGEKKGSLLPVIRVIPEEAYDNPTWRGLLYFGRDLVIYVACLVGLALTNNPLFLLPLFVLIGLTVSGLFIVGHDVAHGALFKSKRLSGVVGRISMLPSWHVYEGWILGHNRVHHGYTVRQGFDFVWHPYTAEEYREMSGFQRARHRFEWSWLGAGAYYTREVWWKRMMVGEPPKRYKAGIRRDRFLVLGFIVVACALSMWLGAAMSGSVVGAVWMALKLVVIPWVIFQYIIGSFVHVHHVAPDIRWWPRREWTKFRGQMEGTTILRAPKGMNFFVHWIMVHIPHHVDMRIPMYHLELAADAIKAAYPDTVIDQPLRFRDFVENSKVCKLYNFEEGHWVSYDEALAGAESRVEQKAG